MRKTGETVLTDNVLLTNWVHKLVGQKQEKKGSQQHLNLEKLAKIYDNEEIIRLLDKQQEKSMEKEQKAAEAAARRQAAAERKVKEAAEKAQRKKDREELQKRNREIKERQKEVHARKGRKAHLKTPVLHDIAWLREEEQFLQPQKLPRMEIATAQAAPPVTVFPKDVPKSWGNVRSGYETRSGRKFSVVLLSFVEHNSSCFGRKMRWLASGVWLARP